MENVDLSNFVLYIRWNKFNRKIYVTQKTLMNTAKLMMERIRKLNNIGTIA